MPWVLQTSLGREVQLYSASCFGSEEPGWGGEETLALITGGPDGAQAAGAPGRQRRRQRRQRRGRRRRLERGRRVRTWLPSRRARQPEAAVV